MLIENKSSEVREATSSDAAKDPEQNAGKNSDSPSSKKIIELNKRQKKQNKKSDKILAMEQRSNEKKKINFDKDKIKDQN